jgi:predicted transposase/invertase (TIGR01784 family)
MPFDSTCKFLAENFSTDMATWLLGKPVSLTSISPTELSVEPIRADNLILLESDNLILHIEFQLNPKPDVPFRLADYRLRGHRLFPDKEMRQVVIYLRPSNSALVYQTTFELPTMTHHFEVIRLWEQPTELFLAVPGLLPFAVLSQTEQPAEVLREVARQVETISDKRLQSNVAAATAVLAGLSLDKDVIQSILRRDMMRESVIYQDIKQEGWQEGRQEGRQEGWQEGRQEGRQEGLLDGERTLVLRLLDRKLGSLPSEARSAINTLSLPQLESLGEALLDFESINDLSQWLETH